MDKCSKTKDLYMAKQLSRNVLHIFQTATHGTVHSVFRSSLNVKFGERLIHIGDSKTGLAPFGIGLHENDVRHLLKDMKQGTFVTYEPDKKILFENGKTINLNRGKIENHLMKQIYYNETVFKTNILSVIDMLKEAHINVGICQTVQEKADLLNYLDGKEVKDFETIIQIKRLLHFLHGLNEDPEEVLDYWVGRGEGLTPSGDDILTGACAILTILQGPNHKLLHHLDRYIRAYGQDRTTKVGLEYLMYAANRKYHTSIIDLCYALLNRNKTDVHQTINNILQVGHTSGADILIGVLIGSKAALNV